MVVLICYRFCIFLYNVISCTHIGYCIVMIDYMYYIRKQDNATLILPALGEQDLSIKWRMRLQILCNQVIFITLWSQMSLVVPIQLFQNALERDIKRAESIPDIRNLRTKVNPIALARLILRITVGLLFAQLVNHQFTPFIMLQQGNCGGGQQILCSGA